MIGQIDDAILKAQFTDAIGGNVPQYVFQRIAPKNRLREIADDPMVRVRIVWQVQLVLVGIKLAKLYPIVVEIVLLSKHSTGHLFHTLDLAHGVEVQGR